MAFVARRFFSSTVRLSTVRPSLAYPAPLNGTAALTTPELRALGAKASGPWTTLSNEEKVMLYRASFPLTFSETRQAKSSGNNFQVFVGVAFGVTLGIALAQYLRTAVGPTIPHTIDNPQWEEDTRKKLLRQKANPIEGISSRV